MPLQISGPRSSVQFVPTISGTDITATALTSTTSSDKFSIEPYNMATIFVKVTAASGTSPTLNVRLQKLLPDGSTWNDIASLTQITGTANLVLDITAGGSQIAAQAARSLAAGNVYAVPFGRIWRLDFAIGGTSPSFTTSVWMEAYG